MTTTLACPDCGSTAVTSWQYGMPAPDFVPGPGVVLGGCVVDMGAPLDLCHSCGTQSRIGSGPFFVERPRPDSRVIAALEAYADRARPGLGATAGVVSFAGLWLLLASLASVARGDRRDRLAEILGLPVEEAGATARSLVGEAHPTLAGALQAWVVPGVDLPIDALPLPDQADLDAWAREHTRGLIERFPLKIGPMTAFVAASALVLEPRWTTPLDRHDDGRLVLEDGLVAVVDTAAAGPVAVAKPHSRDGVDVVSVQAAPDVSPEDVWAAMAEVCHQFDTGALEARWPATDGHSWRIRTETRWVDDDQAPRASRALLPEWRAEARHELDEAPGVAEVIHALREAEARLDGPAKCVQSAMADYGEGGFRAAAVTAVEFQVIGAPLPPRRVEVLTLDFDRPHAVTAIARGGAWEGIRVFDAWVHPPERRTGHDGLTPTYEGADHG